MPGKISTCSYIFKVFIMFMLMFIMFFLTFNMFIQNKTFQFKNSSKIGSNLVCSTSNVRRKSPPPLSPPQIPSRKSPPLLQNSHNSSQILTSVMPSPPQVPFYSQLRVRRLDSRANPSTLSFSLLNALYLHHLKFKFQHKQKLREN